MNVCILQTDNRINLDYVILSQNVNKKMCNTLNYTYVFIENNNCNDMHPATNKINIVNNFLNNYNFDIIIFLDTDAWIQNISYLNDIVNNLINDTNKHGCFSRDPYAKKETFINSGSFIIKNNEFIKNMYKEIIYSLKENNNYKNNWPYDQFYISNYIFDNKHNFIIFVPFILNTPSGEVLRHNWCKNKRMFDDMNELLDKNITLSNESFNFNDYYDKNDFPNISEYADYYI